MECAAHRLHTPQYLQQKQYLFVSLPFLELHTPQYLQQKQYLFAASPFLELSERYPAMGWTPLTQQVLRTAAGSEKSREEELTNCF
ncbi:MAG: hypothetical protein ACJ8BW_30650 [Ktedonobacteraceae bacterium]